MQTTLHITALVNELKNAITGGIIYSTEFYKKERSAFFFIKKEKSRLALGFVYHPAGSGTFLVPASKIKITTREKPWPVFDLVKAVITDVEQMGFDRIFTIEIEKEEVKNTLVFEAIGPNGNIWLLDENDNKSATLRNRKYTTGEKYVCTPPPEKLSPFDVTPSHFIRWAEDKHVPSFVTMLEKKILGLNRTMAKEIVRRAGLEGKTLHEMDNRLYDGLVKSIDDTTSFFKGTSPGYLYELKGGNEVYPFKLSSVEQAPEKYKSLSLAVMNMVNRRRLLAAFFKTYGEKAG